MKPILSKILQAPLKGANYVAGGNVVDRLSREGSNTVIRRSVKKWSSLPRATRKRILTRYGSEADRKAYRAERTKTLAARAAALAGGGYWLKRKKDAPQDDYYYR